MKKSVRYCLLVLMIFSTSISYSQTSWTGIDNTNWNNSANWTAGVPNSNVNVIIGDGSFTGSNQPTVNVSSSCNSITIGGAVAATLTLKKSLVVSGSFTIQANGIVSQPNSTLTVKGNWINNGSYTTTNNNSRIIFGGIVQTIGGSSLTTFRKVTVNISSVVTLGANVSVSGSSSYLYVYGIIDPGQSPSYTLTSTGNTTLFNNGKLKVNAATFAANYILSGSVTLNAGCIIEYSSTTVNQIISSSFSYSTLLISGTGTKTLAANLSSLNSSAAAYGNIFVTSGTLDLDTYTANRGTSVAGGQLNIYNGAFLKIRGTSNFPANYSIRTFALASTVEYNGGAQTVSAQTYGNLSFSSSSGSATKTLPATAFTIDGNFTSTQGTGTSVSYTSASDISINGNVSIGASTTFNGNSNAHTMRGNWVNNGTFTGTTGTVSFDGPSTSISGSGTQNFNNINFLRSGITASGNINVSGNFVTSGAGQFIHGSGGLISMTGTAKTITGTGIVFNDLTIIGSVTSTTSFTVNSNLAVSGSFSGTSGTVIMSGTSKTISGAGTIGFSTLQLTGTITTATGFSISGLLDISGTFSASAGTATFTGTSTLSGTANLYNVTINGTSLQLTSASILGISNIFTISAGVLNVTATLPNTVNFNGTVAQNVNAIAYDNLTLSNGNIKTAAGNTTINNNLTIAAATTFAGGSYTHTILRNWINNGTFTPATSTVQFTGANNASITGATTFNTITINKSVSTNTATLLNDIAAATVNMTGGKMLTGSNKVTITTTRTGNGIILGTITRTHVFGAATAYAFEGPDNTIRFSGVPGVTSITVTVTAGSLPDFPNNASINREYNIVVTGTSYNATVRLHYEDAELNGNNESAMNLWNYPAAWTGVGKSANSTTNNYVEQSGLTNISYRWTCVDIPGVVSWNGSVSTNWNTAANWTSISGGGSIPPASTDIAQIGTNAFTNPPTISTAVSIKSISFGSVQAATLTIGAGGSLTTSGNIAGTWTADAVHTINAGNQNLTVNGNLALSNGVNNRSINVSIGTGTVAVIGSLIQKGNASLVFSGAGALNIGGDFSYTSGTFTPGSGTVTYNGTAQQVIAGVPYNNLSANKVSGNAILSTGITVSGNLSLLAGLTDVNFSSITVNGNIAISSGATLDCDGVTINVAGNWTNSGTYISISGTVVISGASNQNISSGTFNNLIINKTSGTANLTGNNILTANLVVQAGTFNLATYTINRQSVGGTFSMWPGTILQAGGANNFPANYSTNGLDASSTVIYDGTISQAAGAVVYGNLIFSNGGSNAKTQSGNISITGDLVINSGATFHSGGFSTVLSGNWNNSGTFTASTGTVILNGGVKTVTGNTTFNRLTVNGSYTVTGSDINYNGSLIVSTGASYTAGAGIANVNADLTNSGTLTSTGTTNFTGTAAQTIRLLNAILSSSTGIINFNGNVSPVLNSTSTPQFATLNINNTAGISPSVGWTVFVAMNVNAGAIFNGGLSTHTMYGSFTNNGTVTSTGTLNFTPTTAKTIALGSSGFSSDGIVKFGGTGLMTVTGTPGALNTVIISNTNAAGVAGPSSLTVDSNFVINQNSIFNAGSYTYTIARSIQSDGVLNGATSTFIMTSAIAELSVSAETVFNNFTLNTTGILTPQTDFRVAGNFTNNGIYDGSIGVLIMTGNTAGIITGSTSPSDIAQLTIEKAMGIVVTQNVNISNVSFLNIFSGTLNTAVYSITQDAGGGILVIDSAATLKLSGTNSLPGFSGYNLNVNSNVDYAGAATTQSIGNAAVYGNLIISGSGNKNAFVPLIVAGNLTMTAGNLNTSTSTVTHNVGGHFVMTGGTLAGTNSTYILNGVDNQTLTLLSNLVRLTINKAGGSVNLGSNITVGLTLNFIKGLIQTGNFSVIIPSAGAINAAGQTTGWVKGKLQKNVAVGSAVSRTFEIGDSTYYSPATVLFASVGTAGNLTGNVTSTDHTQIDYSGIDSTKSVNRFWSLTNSGIGFTTAASTFQWVASDLDAGVTTANFKPALFNGTNWAFTTLASPLPTSIQVTGLTTFGDFAMGETISAYKWTGEAFTSEWHTAKNWSGGVPTTTYNTTIPDGIMGGRFYPVLNSGTGAVNNIAIETSASLTVSAATLQIAGTISNNGIFNTAAGTIEFNGSTSQVIPANTFANNKIMNLIINSNVSLSGIDTLTGCVNIGVGKTLTTNDNLILRSDANGTARIATLPVDGSGSATAFITGKVSIERHIPMRKAWRLLSAPVKAAGAPTINQAWQEGLTTASVNPNLYPGYGVMIQGGSTANGYDQGLTTSPFLKIYNNTSSGFVGLPAVTGTHIAITNYPGYFLYIRGDRSVNLMQGNNAAVTATTLRMKGEVNTGIQSMNINATGYTVFGNPYPSAIDFQSLTRNNVKNTFYVWDPKLAGAYGLGGYVTFSWNNGTGSYDATAAASPVSQYIPGGEAVIVESADGINPGTINVKESDKTVNGSDQVFGRSNGLNQKFRIDLYAVNADASTSLLDGVLVTFDDDNSNAVDNDDAKKINGSGENIGLKRVDKILAIERRKTIVATDTLFLKLSQMKYQQYKMNITGGNLSSTGLTAVVKDSYSNTNNNMTLDMNGTTSFTFVINTDPLSYASDRFSIVFTTSVVVPVTFASLKAYQRNQDNIVEWNTENEINIVSYDVERSANSTVFNKINTTSAMALNGGSAFYKFIDTDPLTGNNYYRIRSKSLSGETDYSEIVKVTRLHATVGASIIVYPNPVKDNIITLQFNNVKKGLYLLQLYNVTGQLVSKQSIFHNENNSIERFEIKDNIVSGKYTLRITGEGFQITTSVIKQYKN